MNVSAEVILWVLAAWLGLSIAASVISRSLDSLLAQVKRVLQRISRGIRAVGDAVEHGVGGLQDGIRQIGNGLAALLQPAADSLTPHIGALREFWSSKILNQVTGGARNKGQRYLGALLYAGGLLLFLYADLAIGVNAITTFAENTDLPPPNVPGFLQDLTVPLVIAFIVNAAMLGIILADLYQLTDFARWPTSGRLLTTARVAAIVNLVFVIVLAGAFSLVRFVDLTPQIDPDGRLADILNVLSSLAANVISVPALNTTVLLWSGVFSFFILFWAAVGLLLLLLMVFRWLIKWTAMAVAFFASGISLLAGWTATLLSRGFRVLAWFFDLLQDVAEFLVAAIKALIDIIVYLPKQVWDWLNRFPFVSHTLLRKD